MKALLGITLALASFVAPLSGRCDEQRPAARLYADAMQTMRSLPQPVHVSETTTVDAHGTLGLELQEINGWADMAFVIGGTRQYILPASYVVSSDLSDLIAPDGKHLRANEPFFDPTWLGAYDVIRYGVFGDEDVFGKSPSPQATASPSPSSSTAALDDHALKTIGFVRVIAPPAYHIVDAGPAPCGTSGRHLRLFAHNPKTHPLTDVTVDPETNRFCSMRFNVGEPALGSMRGSYTVTFNQFGPYWLVKRGVFQFALRVFGVPTGSTTVTFAHKDVTY